MTSFLVPQISKPKARLKPTKKEKAGDLITEVVQFQLYLKGAAVFETQHFDEKQNLRDKKMGPFLFCFVVCWRGGV